MEPIRWGILGTGKIATLFATGLTAVPEAELAAVGSRTAEAATRFAGTFGAPRRHASYAALAADPDVDIIYVATPHPVHQTATRLCLEAGKAVICEKPFTVNAREAADVIGLARERGVFLMEAMWTRFLPLMVKFRQLVAEGAIGEPRLLTADFGFRLEFDPTHRLYDRNLAGGALLDVGVYVVSLASMLFGTPNRIVSLAHIGKSGVDEQAALTFGYPDGKLAQLHVAVQTATPQEVTLAGTHGRIRIHPLWWKATRMTLSVPGKEDELIEVPFEGNGYNYEAAEAMRCLRAGETESPIMPLDETLAVMKQLDEIRAQWGLRYPME